MPSEPGLEALLEALQDFRSFHESLTRIRRIARISAAMRLPKKATASLMDVLGWNLIRLRYPKLYFILQVFSFVEDTVSPFPGEFHGSQYDKVPLPAALRSARQLDHGPGRLLRSAATSTAKKACGSSRT